MKPQSMNFIELYRHWKASKIADVKASTMMAYSEAWRWLESRIGQREASEFGRADGRLLLSDMMMAGLSASVCKARIGLVRRMLVFAALELGEPVRPMDWGLRYPKRERRGVEAFTQRETLKLVEAVIGEMERGDYGRLPALISVTTGMRLGEVLGLQWGDIDMKRGMVCVRRTVTRFADDNGKVRLAVEVPKTEAGHRVVPLLPVLRRALKIYGGSKPDPARFVIGCDTKPRLPRCVRDGYTRFLLRHNLPCIKFHALRHTYATLLVEAGSDLKTVAVMMGHADVTTTMNLYVHPSAAAKTRAARKAFRMLGRIGGKDKTFNGEIQENPGR